MAQAIVLEEDRVLKNRMLDKIRQIYQEKIVDTGISDLIDKGYAGYMDLSAKAANTIIKVTDSASDIVATFIPAEGEFANAIVDALADVLPNIINAITQFNAKATIGAKNFFEQKIMGVEKEHESTTYVDKENISVMKDKLKETLNQIKEMKFAESQNNQTNETVIDAEYREVPLDDGPRMGM